MDAIIPRYHLPESWSGKGTCPVCRTPGHLRVQHENVLPDRMVCAACGMAFEVEPDGAHIRLAVVPAVLSPYAPNLVHVWLLAAEVSDLVEHVLGSAVVPAAVAQAPRTEAPGVAAPAVVVEGAALQSDRLGPASAALAVEASPSVAGGADIASYGAPNAATFVARNGAPAAVPDLGDTQPNAALRRADAAGGAPEVSPTAGAVSSSATEASVRPAVTEAEAAALALQTALADAMQALPATAPRSDATLADELAAALNVAPLPPRPVGGDAALAVRQHTPANGTAADAPDAAAEGSVTPVTPGVAERAISTSQAAPAAEPAPAVAPAALVAAAASASADVSRMAGFAEQASRLHEYGNSVQSIQGALERSGASPDEARRAMANVLAVEGARQVRFRGTLPWVAGISLFVMVILLAIAVAISLAPRKTAPVATPASGTPAGVLLPAVAATATAGPAVPTPTLTFNPIIEFINSLMPGDVKFTNGPSPTPGPTSAALSAIFPPTATLEPAARATIEAAKRGLPDWVSTLVPNTLTVLNVPTPSLDSNGPPNSACPVTPDNAANLFGGKAQYWTYDRSNVGWVMIVASNPISIRLPANMTAGYLVIGATLEMRSAQGPATIHNVNFVAVNCRA